MTQEQINQLADALHQTYELIGTTGRDFAYLGKVDGTVVVPQNEQAAAGAVWCHKEGLPPFQAILLSSSGLTYDNTTPGLEIEVAYPPNYVQGKDPACVIGLSPRGLQEMGGMSPQNYGLLKAQNPQSENLITLRLIKGSSGMKVSVTGGWFRRGAGLFYLPSMDDIADLTDSIPATAGQRRYAIICWNENAQEATVVEREPFDTNSAYVFSDQIAGEVTPGLLHLGYVMLENGMTELVANNVIPLHHLFQVPGVSISDRDPTESDDLAAGYSITWLWLNTAEHRIFMLEDSTPNNARWKNIAGGSGSGGNEFASLFIQNNAFQYSFQEGGIIWHRFTDVAEAGLILQMGRGRGNIGTPAAVQDGDAITDIFFQGRDASQMRDAAAISVAVDDITGSVVQGGVLFKTTDAAGDLIERFGLFNDRVQSLMPFEVPNMTESARDALTPSAGWIIFNTDTDEFNGYNSTDWVVLSGGTGGGGGTPEVHVCEGRLSLTTGVAVTTSDVTGAGTLYFTPYTGNRVRLYDGSSWDYHTFTERSISLSVTSGNNYDVFLYDNAGTLTLELTAWTNTTTRTTAIVLQDGVYVKSGATTRLYLGTIYATGTNQTGKSQALVGVWNNYNRLPFPMLVQEDANNWTVSSSSFGAANSDNTNRLQFVCGLAEDVVLIDVDAQATVSFGDAATVGIGIDSTSSDSSQIRNEITHGISGGGALRGLCIARYRGTFLGFHYAQWLDSARAGTATFAGDNGVPAHTQSGIHGVIWC